MNRHVALLLLALSLATNPAAAQSLKPEAPAPLKPGINKGTVDNFVGTQYWYFVGGPGNVVIDVRFKSMGLLGNAVRTPLTVYLYDDKHTWETQKVLTSEALMVEAKIPGNVKTATKIIIKVAPPSGGLVRSGGDYEIEVSGAVQFATAKPAGDPILQTFSCYWGAAKFLADGTVRLSEGANGSWKLFDAETHIYTVDINGQRYSVKYVPGRGLVDVDDPSVIRFQEMK